MYDEFIMFFNVRHISILLRQFLVACVFFFGATQAWAGTMPVHAAENMLDFTLPTQPLAVELDTVAAKHHIRATPVVKRRTAATIRTLESDLRKAHRILEDIARVPARDRTFRNTCEALDDFSNSIELAYNWQDFLSHVSPDPFVREVGEKITQYVEKYLVDVQASRTLYAAMRELAALKPILAPEEKYFLDETLLDFEDGGVALPDAPRERFKAISKELTDLGITFSRNIREYQDSLVVRREDLRGLDTDFFDGIGKTSDGRIILTLDYPVIFPVLDYCENETVRHDLLVKFRNRAGDLNIDLLKKILTLRRERAGFLDHASHAEYIIARRMARTPSRALEFLDDLRTRVRSKASREFATLSAMKQSASGDSSARLEQWDKQFFANRLIRERYSYDPQKLKEYFPSGRAISEALRIYQIIYGVSFRKMPGTYQGPGPSRWHPDVEHYNVYDGRTKVGEFYLDLHPRNDKYKHAAAWGIRAHKIFADGRIQTPVSVLVANFPKATKKSPALFTIDDVETLFHEFGHVMHGLLSRTRFATVSGTRVKQDFVEAPSQMFEKWVYDTTVLSRFARHYKTGKLLPSEWIDKIVQARLTTSGLDAERQIFYATYDLTLHGTVPVADPVAKWMELQSKIELMPPVPNAKSAANFDHLIGYGAGYYGYLWSRFIAMDMYEHFREHGGLMNPEEGLRFRRIILSRGGETQPDSLVREFLGREPRADAFLRDLGVDVP